MMKRSLCVLTLLMVTSLGWVPLCHAGVLNGHPLAFNDGNGPAGGAWSGVAIYTRPFSGNHLEGTIEWAVFAPGQFPYAGLNGWTPVPGQLTYAYQILNTGEDGIAEFTVDVALNGVSNAGAAALGGANEASFYAADVYPGLAVYEFMHYDADIDDYVGTPVPALTGTSAGLVLSSSRVPTNGTALVRSYEGSLYPSNFPVVGIPNGSLYVPSAGDADYNNNGTVDAADYVLWRKGDLAADGTGPGGSPDGVVNSLDYDFWRAQFGNAGGGGSNVVNLNVPEPSSMLLLTVLTLLRCLRGRIR